jgi:hypothetical protein
VYLPVEAIMNGIGSYVGTIIFFGAFAAFLTWILYTCAADARRRGKSPRLVTLLVFISFPLGLIVWLLFRPEPLNGAYKGFRLKDHRLQ